VACHAHTAAFGMVSAAHALSLNAAAARRQQKDGQERFRVRVRTELRQRFHAAEVSTEFESVGSPAVGGGGRKACVARSILSRPSFANRVTDG
jgi:ABC-type phosphate transport system ATPase subunit